MSEFQAEVLEFASGIHMW